MCGKKKSHLSISDHPIITTSQAFSIMQNSPGTSIMPRPSPNKCDNEDTPKNGKLHLSISVELLLSFSCSNGVKGDHEVIFD
jgi:hypothetical protein